MSTVLTCGYCVSDVAGQSHCDSANRFGCRGEVHPAAGSIRVFWQPGTDSARERTDSERLSRTEPLTQAVLPAGDSEIKDKKPHTV
eukprot:2742752-Rhodomonas_salina.2